MKDKRIRYINKIFTLDRINKSIELTIWDKENINDYLNEFDKHYGLKLINEKEKILVTVEYPNIIWQYRIYYGSYKKKYHTLTKDDERWIYIEKNIESDLKMTGLDELKDEILQSLKNNKYYKYSTKKVEQFKRYCI